MIQPDVDIIDLDPAQWAVLNELVLKARRARRWGYVLHDAGHVLTRHPDELDVTPGDVVEDAPALAERLVVSAGMDRVVVIDRQGLPAIARAAAALVEPGGALTRYREQVEDVYWASPAVVTSPAAPTNPWREMRVLAEAVGTGLVHICIYDGVARHVPVTAIALVVDGGSVTRVSSPAGGAPDVILAMTAADLVLALRSSHLVAELLTSARDDARSRGLSRLLSTQEGLSAHVS